MAKALILPKARIERQLRNAFLGKRVSAKTSGYLTAAIEHIMKQILEGLRGEVADSGKKTATRRDFVNVIRGDPSLARVFFDLIVSQGSAPLKFDPLTLLTKADAKKAVAAKAIAVKKRKAAKLLEKAEGEKAVEAAIPEIDAA